MSVFYFVVHSGTFSRVTKGGIFNQGAETSPTAKEFSQIAIRPEEETNSLWQV